MIGNFISGSQKSVAISDQSSVGECRRAARALAESAGFDETKMGRIAIIASEVATNIVKHATSGTVLVQMLDDGIHAQLEILGIDRGPGMNDIAHCMRDGYSSAGTSGNGLGAIARLSDTFDGYSIAGQGTVFMSRIEKSKSAGHPAAKAAFEVGAICVAVAGEIECGDNWCLSHDGAHIGMLVADGLGHGGPAAAASSAAVNSYRTLPFQPPSSQMSMMHKALSGTRGAAVACALLHPTAGKIEYAGIGNICGSVVTEGRQRGMVSHNGTAGVQLLRAQQFEYPWPTDSHVVMHSDGLTARWNLEVYPGLMQHHPAIVAGILFRDFARARDDATVLVVQRRS
jgi:anti-sigma regulatory factor (Ser/Thr protein kinase)